MHGSAVLAAQQVIVNTGRWGPQVWATVIVGIVGFAGVALTIRQRTRADTRAFLQKSQADRRAEWWRRVSWAVDHTLGKDPDAGLVGLEVLRHHLTVSPLGTKDDLLIFEFWLTALVEEFVRTRSDSGVIALDGDTLLNRGDNGDSEEGTSDDEA